jgi:hypothetical protein
MTKKELRELIKSVIKEYNGTGAFGSPSRHGQNPRQSQRIGGGTFANEEDELEFYSNQNAGDGGQGHQTKGMEKTQSVGNPNRSRFTRF